MNSPDYLERLRSELFFIRQLITEKTREASLGDFIDLVRSRETDDVGPPELAAREYAANLAGAFMAIRPNACLLMYAEEIEAGIERLEKYRTPTEKAHSLKPHPLSLSCGCRYEAHIRSRPHDEKYVVLLHEIEHAQGVRPIDCLSELPGAVVSTLEIETKQLLFSVTLEGHLKVLDTFWMKTRMEELGGEDEWSCDSLCFLREPSRWETTIFREYFEIESGCFG